MLADRFLGEPAVQRNRPAAVRSGSQPAKQQLRIRDGWLEAAPIVAGWAGIGSGAAGADRQQPAFIHRSNRSAAGAYGRDLDGGDRNAQSIYVEEIRHADLTLLHHHDVAAGAADLERDQMAAFGFMLMVDERSGGGRGT